MHRQDVGKRAFDLAIAIPCLFLAAPVMLVAMAAIIATSPGSAIFGQARIGRGEHQFRCYKLRTMRENTPDLPTHEVGGAAVTPVGAFLRRFKVDELPQLWNVLTGEMSLVGPRPCLPAQSELIASRRRLGVFRLKPGITGLAQVRGIDMSTPQLLAETDAAYMQSLSIPGDLKIILRTVIKRR